MGNKKRAVLCAELERVEREEERLCSCGAPVGANWADGLKEKIPQKLSGELEKAFAKAFELIFAKATPLIEKTYRKEELETDFLVNQYALELKKNRRALMRLDGGAAKGNLIGLAASTAEGVLLGALGIGLPDIALFVAAILRGTYETALRYGFGYESPEEKLFILTLLEGAMRKGDEKRESGARIDAMFSASAPEEVTDAALKAQLKRTADAFAMDMLAAKFVQGLPIVGVLGGLANPLYYSRVMSYVRLKYKKRYLTGNI